MQNVAKSRRIKGSWRKIDTNKTRLKKNQGDKSKNLQITKMSSLSFKKLKRDSLTITRLSSFLEKSTVCSADVVVVVTN